MRAREQTPGSRKTEHNSAHMRLSSWRKLALPLCPRHKAVMDDLTKDQLGLCEWDTIPSGMDIGFRQLLL
jgi:hypothetical protein